MSTGFTQAEARSPLSTPMSAPKGQLKQLSALDGLLSGARAERGKSGYQLVGPDGVGVELPSSVVGLLSELTRVLARGDAVTWVPVGKKLTTQQAADILNVSRQYLVRLLDEGRIPYGKTGTHRRVRFEDLMAFKRQRDKGRAASLDDLTELSQAYGGYDELPNRDG